jgi:hypothetical protein
VTKDANPTKGPSGVARYTTAPSIGSDLEGRQVTRFQRSQRLSSSNGYKTALPILVNDGPILMERQFRRVPSLIWHRLAFDDLFEGQEYWVDLVSRPCCPDTFQHYLPPHRRSPRRERLMRRKFLTLRRYPNWFDDPPRWRRTRWTAVTLVNA